MELKALFCLSPLLVTMAGCGAPVVRSPTFGPQTVPESAWLSDLDDGPPPVQVEEVSPAPAPSFVWIDGQWIWQPLARRWTWEQGAWCVPPPGTLYYAKPGIVRYRAVEGRVKRWNDALQRFEEVDSGDDRYRWIRGRFHVQGPEGAAVPSRQPALCAATGSQSR